MVREVGKHSRFLHAKIFNSIKKTGQHAYTQTLACTHTHTPVCVHAGTRESLFLLYVQRESIDEK